MTPADEELVKRARNRSLLMPCLTEGEKEAAALVRQLADRVEALSEEPTHSDNCAHNFKGLPCTCSAQARKDLRELREREEQIWRPLVEAAQVLADANARMQQEAGVTEDVAFARGPLNEALEKALAALPPKDSAHTVTMREDSVTPKQDVEVRFRPPKDEGPTIPSIPPMTVEPAADFDPTLEPPKGEDLCVCGHDVEDHNDIWKKATHCHKCGCQVWRAKTEDEGGIVLDGRREEWQNEQ